LVRGSLISPARFSPTAKIRKLKMESRSRKKAH
jgi:hypothetical protein